MLNEEEEKLFTTGEIAEKCGVSVRTVQYYDEKGLVRPAERTEGGRRLYDDASLDRMRLACLLKALGLSLRAIQGILENPEDNAALLCVLAGCRARRTSEHAGRRSRGHSGNPKERPSSEGRRHEHGIHHGKQEIEAQQDQASHDRRGNCGRYRRDRHACLRHRDGAVATVHLLDGACRDDLL